MLAALLVTTTDAADRPNIVFVFADDLGARDLAVDGNRHHATPHLDRFAAEGVRFTQAYAAAPICSASRAAVLTGRSPPRLGFEFVTKDAPGQQDIPGVKLRTPPYTLSLPPGQRTVADALSEAGYRTAFFGKWHLAPHHGRYLGWSPTDNPLARGFAVAEEDFGGHPYNTQAFDPVPDGEFPPDSLTDRAIDFLRRDHGRPFFLMVSHFYVHTPVKPRAEWLVARHRAAGLPERRAKYAAFVETLDHHVGRLLTALDAAGLREDTLVVFTSDNGGDPRFARHAPLRGHKWTLYEGGVRVPLIVRWPGVVEAGGTREEPVIGTDLPATFADAAGADFQTPDGRSLVPLLRDAGAAWPGRTLLWHFPYYHPETKAGPETEVVGVDDGRPPFVGPHAAVRVGETKAVHFFEEGRTEVYDLAADPSESNDLAAGDADLAAEWRGRVMGELNAVGARLPGEPPP